jgi:signal transduction histidine kinase
MPEEFLSRAFDRFTRSDDARSAGGGSGLGLSIVAAIVAGARGTATLSNSAKGGLTVSVTLPPAGTTIA